MCVEIDSICDVVKSSECGGWGVCIHAFIVLVCAWMQMHIYVCMGALRVSVCLHFQCVGEVCFFVYSFELGFVAI